MGLAMLNPHTKFEVSTITYNKEMKCNTKCKKTRATRSIMANGKI